MPRRGGGRGLPSSWRQSESALQQSECAVGERALQQSVRFGTPSSTLCAPVSSRFRALACSASTEPAERRRTRPGGPSRYVLSWQAAGVLEHVACIATSSLPNPTCPSSRRHHELRRLWPRARTRKPSSVVRREALSAELKRGLGVSRLLHFGIFDTRILYGARDVVALTGTDEPAAAL